MDYAGGTFFKGLKRTVWPLDFQAEGIAPMEGFELVTVKRSRAGNSPAWYLNQ